MIQIRPSQGNKAAAAQARGSNINLIWIPTWNLSLGMETRWNKSINTISLLDGITLKQKYSTILDAWMRLLNKQRASRLIRELLNNEAPHLAHLDNLRGLW